MGSGIYFPISAIFFSLLTIISFYAKKSINTKETKIFKYLMIINFIGLLIELLCTFAAYIVDVLPGMSDFILKSYLVYNFIWTYMLMVYVLYVSYDKKIVDVKNKYKYVILVSFLVIIFIIYSLNCDLVILNDFSVRYTKGSSVDFTYLVCGFMIGIIALLSIKDKNNFGNKKFIPIFSFLITIVVGIILQKSNPGLLIMTYVETLTIAIMYQTIENPDMKMLEEVYKSKEISDNVNEEKNLFIYNMTQETRKVTDSINNNCEVILDSDSIEDIKEVTRDILNETAKYKNITYDILGVNDTSSNMKLYKEKYDIKNLLKEVITVSNKKCVSKNIDFRTSISHDVPDRLLGDSINLKKVLLEIINNSIDRTKNGFVEFRVDTIIKNNECRLFFIVEDSSIGYQNDEINKLLKTKSNLSDINSLVVKMNGGMSINSKYGMGVKVSVLLDQDIVASQDESNKYADILVSKKILVVDDNQSSITIINKLLNDTNVLVDTCINYKDCIEKIKVNNYDVVLIDEDLNKISGVELLKKIKDVRSFNSKSILLTKDNNFEYNNLINSYGFDDYLIKPIKKDELLLKLNNIKK